MELHERLQIARRHAGYETVAQAAQALGVPYPTYAGHENGASGFRADKGELYARKFKVRFEWLMRGIGPMVDVTAKQREVLDLLEKLPPDIQETYVELLRKLATPHQS